ncbi:MAG TPA: type II toxin-antitoxin system prevent-host-death family antitoxin, partial [Thermoanaerobaculia bacterium]|nr:type II toxin-antitoxin system prevent-host-death family antitoxin [Thermoanaerobaculia bacterium]
QYNIAEAKARLSELVKKALAGEEVVVARDHRPLVRVVPVGPAAGARTPGSARGQVWTAPDFDAPLADFDEHAP